MDVRGGVNVDRFLLWIRRNRRVDPSYIKVVAEGFLNNARPNLFVNFAGLILILSFCGQFRRRRWWRRCGRLRSRSLLLIGFFADSFLDFLIRDPVGRGQVRISIPAIVFTVYFVAMRAIFPAILLILSISRRIPAVRSAASMVARRPFCLSLFAKYDCQRLVVVDSYLFLRQRRHHTVNIKRAS